MTLVPLRAGPLSMAFDPTAAFLRHVRLDDREIVRGVFGAVRDRNWDTVEPAIRELRIDPRADGFTISFNARCLRGDVDFVWHGEITGTATGAVTFRFDGMARAPFLRNRIGLCVLHPIGECAGQTCRVEHVDGGTSQGTFPRLISPHQPFRNIRALATDVVPGLVATATFEGDVFEMEDQRNWTDASFKTYSTPLDLPFPVRLERGARVRQTVTLQLEGVVPRSNCQAVAPEAPRVRIDWGGSRPRPPVGFGMATTGRRLGRTARAALAALGPDHLRVDLQLASGGWRERLLEASDLATDTGARLHVAAFVGDGAHRELEALLTEAATRRSPVGLWLVFHSAEKATSPRWVELAARLLARWDPAVPMAAGTNAYFAELNRNRPPADARALPCFSITPQVHAFDDRSLVETHGAQRSTVETTRAFSPKPVVISPVTLRPRFNPNAADAAGIQPPESDPRQSTTFGAAWTLGTLARLATCSHVHSLTFYETTGPRGVMDESGRLFPMGHVFAALAGRDTVADCVSSGPLHVGALGLCDTTGRRRILLAGFTAEPQEVILEGVAGTAGCRVLASDGFTAPAVVRASDNGMRLDMPPETVMLLELDGA